MAEWSDNLSLFDKYLHSLKETEKMISGLPFVPRGMVKILMNLKVLTDFIGVLFVLVILLSAIGWLL